MSKILSVKRLGELFVMRVELDSGHREKWTYEREETADGVSFYMVAKEDS